MKKLFFLFISTIILFSCNPGVDTQQEEALAQNDIDIQNYIKSKGLKTQRTASGLYYQITTENPNGAKTAVGNSVTFYYTLFKLTNGFAVVDSTDQKAGKTASTIYGANYNILGFEEGLSFLKVGEKATLLMNNNLAFGSTQPNASIPAYSAIGINIEILKSSTEDQQIDDYVVAKGLKVSEKTASGLRIIRTFTNTNPKLQTGETVAVKYAGRRLNDIVFDSGQINVSVGASGVIKGFEEGVKNLAKGEKATIIFPSAIGYGANGSGSTIPPYSALIFDIEVL